MYRGDQMEKNETGGHVARMGEIRGTYRVVVGTPEGVRPLCITRRAREYNIKMDLHEVVQGQGMDLSGSG
jgi:hypothetical protein